MVKEECFKDSDCGEDKMCIFDYAFYYDNNKVSCQNICINKNDYYNNPSCIDNNTFDKLSSSSINKNTTLSNKKECIEWAKKQNCSKDGSCNCYL